MASHVIPRRIQFIIQFVHDSDYPTKEEIIRYLNEKDFKLSTRTFERDLDRIRSDYGLEMEYDFKNNGYYIDEENSVRVESFFKFLEIVSIADIFGESLQNSNKILNYVSFDDSEQFSGIQNLRQILIAISQNKQLKFIHENYESYTYKEYCITPFLLKEYENRWYVVGVPNNMDEIRTFGVDRLSDVAVGKSSKLKKKNYSNQIKKFDQIVGLNFSNDIPVEIRLLVNNPHVKYMRSLPLHASQNIHTENEKGQWYVDFNLIPNYEFMSQILKYGDEVEVIYPLELREEIKRRLKNALSRYN